MTFRCYYISLSILFFFKFCWVKRSSIDRHVTCANIFNRSVLDRYREGIMNFLIVYSSIKKNNTINFDSKNTSRSKINSLRIGTLIPSQWINFYLKIKDSGYNICTIKLKRISRHPKITRERDTLSAPLWPDYRATDAIGRTGWSPRTRVFL